MVEVFTVEYKVYEVVTFWNGQTDRELVDEGHMTVVTDTADEAEEEVKDYLLCEYEPGEVMTEEGPAPVYYTVAARVVGSYELDAEDEREIERHHLKYC